MTATWTSVRVHGSVDVRIDDGDLRLDGVLTVLRATADDGDLHIRAEAGSRMQADWSIHTDDGSVSVALPEHFAADLIPRTDDGVTDGGADAVHRDRSHRGDV